MSEERSVSTKRRRNAMPHAEKVVLIGAVKAKRCIWDLADAQYSNTLAVNAAWREIAADLRKTVEECKMVWSSLKDSRRYYASISKKKKKSGDAGGDCLDSPVLKDSSEWEYSELLAFLPNPTTKRRTFNSISFGLESGGDLDSSSSNYTYGSRPVQEKEEKEGEEDSRQTIAKSIQTLVKARTENNKKHGGSVAYIQDLLNQLPDKKAKLLTFEFIAKLQGEVAAELEQQETIRNTIF